MASYRNAPSRRATSTTPSFRAPPPAPQPCAFWSRSTRYRTASSRRTTGRRCAPLVHLSHALPRRRRRDRAPWLLRRRRHHRALQKASGMRCLVLGDAPARSSKVMTPMPRALCKKTPLLCSVAPGTGALKKAILFHTDIVASTSLTMHRSKKSGAETRSGVYRIQSPHLTTCYRNPSSFCSSYMLNLKSIL